MFEALRAAGIGVNVHYIPVHLQPFWRARGFGPGDFPEAERYYAGALSLPLHARLSDWGRRWYRDSLTAHDLADPALLDETRGTLDELTQILNLGGGFYPFQRT